MGYRIDREIHVHGSSWAKQGAGYFSDKGMAAGYVAEIIRVARDARPSTVADLGGGTGFILEQLAEAGIGDRVRLVVIDESVAQLSVCGPRVVPLQRSILELDRRDLLNCGETLMLISRSVMHYSGFEGQAPWLRHVRSLMKPGEWFVHQPGCADDAEMSAALNSLFDRMGLDKWVPHREELLKMLAGSGFEVTGDLPAPSVGMVSDELVLRYGVPPLRMTEIGEGLRQGCAHRPDFYRATPEGFVFDFPYRIITCRAE
ncbi:MAG: class I SAM-dependent methyltransferase [Myxococcota bacterium]|jgi:hypothetical protein